MPERGKLFVLSGPSGVGKTTIAHRIAAMHHDLMLSVSATTRSPRPGEKDGVNYRFMTPSEFDAAEKQGAFLETATVFGMNKYGTPKGPVEHALAEGNNALLEIDVQGAEAVKRKLPEAILIFIEPPSWEILEQRLRGRGTESEDVLERRLQTARRELQAASKFDFSVVNDDLEAAISGVDRILEGPSANEGQSRKATDDRTTNR
ncbi:MAG: guanylate kinase [Actinomycetota bacterium]